MKRERLIIPAFAVVIVLAAVFLWRADVESRRNLASAERAYSLLQEKLARYKSLARDASEPKSVQSENLFAQINRAAAELGLEKAVEALRPGSEKGAESLDVQTRGLYLGEALRFLERIEKMDDVRVDRLSINRRPDMTLDLETRLIKRQNEN